MGVFERREISGKGSKLARELVDQVASGLNDELDDDIQDEEYEHEDNHDHEPENKSKKRRFGSKRKKNKESKKTKVKADKVKGNKTLPQHIYIGYRPSSEVKKKELVEYIKSKANEKVNPIENAFYHIEKYGDGHFWEIHDGGSGHSILPHVISELEDKDDFSFILNNEIFVIKKISQGDSYTFNLIKTKADNIPAQRDKSSKPVQSKKMKVFVRNGFGFFVFSMLLFLFSSILLAGSFYVRDNRQYDATLDDLYSSTVKLPITKYNEAADFMKNEHNGIYLKNIKYVKKTKKYAVEGAPTLGYASFRDDVLLSMGKDIIESEPPKVGSVSKDELLGGGE